MLDECSGKVTYQTFVDLTARFSKVNAVFVALQMALGIGGAIFVLCCDCCRKGLPT